MGGSPVVQTFVPYAPRSVPYIMQTPSGARLVSPASATGPPLVAGQQQAAWGPTTGGGGYIIQSPTAPNPIEVFPLSSPGIPFISLREDKNIILFQLIRTLV